MQILWRKTATLNPGQVLIEIQHGDGSSASSVFARYMLAAAVTTDPAYLQANEHHYSINFFGVFSPTLLPGLGLYLPARSRLRCYFDGDVSSLNVSFIALEATDPLFLF